MTRRSNRVKVAGCSCGDGRAIRLPSISRYFACNAEMPAGTDGHATPTVTGGRTWRKAFDNNPVQIWKSATTGRWSDALAVSECLMTSHATIRSASRLRDEHVVKPNMRIVGWQRPAGGFRVLAPVGVNVASPEHGLNRPPPDPPAA